MMTVSGTIAPHIKLGNKNRRADPAYRSDLARLWVCSEVHVMHDRSKGGARWERANRYLPRCVPCYNMHDVCRTLLTSSVG